MNLSCIWAKQNLVNLLKEVEGRVIYNIKLYISIQHYFAPTGLVHLLHPGCVVVIPFKGGHLLSGSAADFLWCQIIFINTLKDTKEINES